LKTKSTVKAKAKPSQTRASLELLYSISQELAARLDLRDLLQRILQLTLHAAQAQSGSILVLNDQGEVTEGALAFDGKVHDHTADQLSDTYERGLAGWVSEHRKAVILPSTNDDARWLRRDGEALEETRSAISVPLLARDQAVGVLTLVHPEPSHFTAEDLALLTAIAEQAGIAVQNARLFAAEQERRRFASTLQGIARSISATLDPAQVFPQVLVQLERLIQFDSASIMLRDEDRLRLVAARGFADSDGILGHTMPLDETRLTGRILTTRQPIVIDDVQKDPGWVVTPDLPESGQIHGWIGAPLVVRDRAVGVLNVDSRQAGAYRAAQAEMVMAFADQAAAAVANAQLFSESQRRVRAMVALAEAARVVTASLDLEDVLQRILAQTMTSLDVASASLGMVDEATGEIEFKVGLGDGASSLVGLRLPRGQGIAGWVVEHGEMAVVNDVRSDARFVRVIDERSGFETRGLACAPIRVHDRTIGVLEAANPLQGEFSSDQAELLQGIAGLAGTAIAHAQLFSETRAAQQLYAGLFEDSADPILITELDGTVTEANHGAERFLGYTREDLRGRSVEDLHRPDQERPSDLVAEAEGKGTTYAATALQADGMSHPVEVRVKRIDIGRRPFLQWIFRDVSERVALDQLRADLTSMIFHDLRSPLGNVISSLEVLQGSIPSDDESLQSVLAIALRSSRRLSRLVESLLDLNQLEEGKAVLHRSLSSIRTLIVEAVEEIHPVAEARGHLLQFQFDPSGLPTIEIDSDMIRRVLINLLENAVKYTRGGASITVSAMHRGQNVLVSVADSGPGIAVRDQQRIFDKFARVEQDGRPKGLGLGLAFCRLAVEAHGGRIWVESVEGRGSTFSFTLPV
jgi:PAS domain S-box-containing protein